MSPGQVYLLFVSCLSYVAHCWPSLSSPNLVVISFDGFRWDYIARTNTPNFDKFIANGVTAHYGLRNAFVTKTFPNHFTLASGLWEESHGIVANDMFDPLLNQTFSPSNVTAMEDSAWFNVGAEPIWVTSQLQNPNAKSGVIMWVGGGAPIKSKMPTKYIPYDKNVKNETKIDMLIDWFTDKDPINLGMIYFDQPDSFGHTYGPDSPQVTAMIAGLDEVVGYLLKRLDDKGLLENTNIILTSDHGFTNTPTDKLINLTDYINLDSYRFFLGTPIANIWPQIGKEEEVFHNLTVGARLSGNFIVYKREEIPVYFHYSKNRRISPIVAVANDTFSFCTGKCVPRELGDHGYDNRLQDMHPFFLAMGPSFKRNFSVDTFDNVDVYPLMCHLLGLTPAANNGTMTIVSQLLVRQMDQSNIIVYTVLFTAILVACVAGLFAVKTCQQCSQRNSTRHGSYTSIRKNSTYVTASKNTGTGESDIASTQGGYISSESKVPLLHNQDG